VRLPARLPLASVRMRLFLLPGRAVCPALGPGGRWTPRHAERPPGASDRANEVGHAIKAAGRGRLGWRVGGRLRLGVGHASTVRPDPSTRGVVGVRVSRCEGRSPARPRPPAVSLAPPQREIRATRKRANAAQVVAIWIQLIVK
jgi:hypothetical protein